MKTTLFIVFSLALVRATLASDRYMLTVGVNSHNVGRYDFQTGQVQDFIETSAQTGYLNGLAVGPDGNIYVCSDSLSSGQVLKYNGVTGAFMSSFSTEPFPHSIAFDSHGYIYVSSNVDNDIQRYASDEKLIDTFVPSGSGGLNGTRDMRFDSNGNLYISSAFSDQVIRFSPNGVATLTYAVPNNPDGIAFGYDGKLYADSIDGSAVWRYNLDGTGGETFLTNADGLDRPRGIDFNDWGGNQQCFVSNEYLDIVKAYSVGGVFDRNIDFGSAGIHRLEYIRMYNPVSEPETVAVLIAGLALLARRRSQRQTTR